MKNSKIVTMLIGFILIVLGAGLATFLILNEASLIEKAQEISADAEGVKDLANQVVESSKADTRNLMLAIFAAVVGLGLVISSLFNRKDTTEQNTDAMNFQEHNFNTEANTVSQEVTVDVAEETVEADEVIVEAEEETVEAEEETVEAEEETVEAEEETVEAEEETVEAEEETVEAEEDKTV